MKERYFANQIFGRLRDFYNDTNFIVLSILIHETLIHSYSMTQIEIVMYVEIE